MKGRIVNVMHEGRAWQAVLLIPTDDVLAKPPKERVDWIEARGLPLPGESP